MDKFLCFVLGVVTGVVAVAGYQKFLDDQNSNKSFNSLEDSIEQRLESLERESRLEPVLN